MTELTILKEVNREPHPNVIRLIGGCSIEGIREYLDYIKHFQFNLIILS